jgi:hypothetical protein
MKKIFIFFYFLFAFTHLSISQNVGIGTNSPNAKAALEIKSTDKGVLFPRLTSAQRNAIINPPDGLHIYNKDERCLNYYDSAYQLWNCYCETDTCKTVTILIDNDVANVDFYNTYGNKYPGIKKFVIIIGNEQYVTGVNNSFSGAALNFVTIPTTGYKIKIINYGYIYGYAGSGGRGAAGQVGSVCSYPANPGLAGGHAISANPGTAITILNYAIIAGGGGSGGGGGRVAEGQYGGGGGGGAGLPFGIGGSGGGNTAFNSCIPTCQCTLTGGNIAGNGIPGTNVVGGTGGVGANGGGNGGNGGGLAQAGQNGTGTAAGTGGIVGKAVSGGTGNSITNLSGGLSFGIVD